jgi:hypothetical protein
MRKVICINTEGWEVVDTKKRTPDGPVCGQELEVLNEEDGYYTFEQWPDDEFYKDAFVPVDENEKEEKVLDKLYSH